MTARASNVALGVAIFVLFLHFADAKKEKEKEETVGVKEAAVVAALGVAWKAVEGLFKQRSGLFKKAKEALAKYFGVEKSDVGTMEKMMAVINKLRRDPRNEGTWNEIKNTASKSPEETHNLRGRTSLDTWKSGMVTKEQALMLIVADLGQCYLKYKVCDGEWKYPPEVEHVIPKSMEPQYMWHFGNWRLACKHCNVAKLDKSLDDQTLVDQMTQPIDIVPHQQGHPSQRVIASTNSAFQVNQILWKSAPLTLN
jgi:5-methylcytosine-specific restriction endonuclease McrA